MRKKGDGRGRLGGRAAGTPNRDKPLKSFLREHSVAYFTPTEPELDDNGKPTGRLVSQFDRDIAALAPVDRADAELKLLKYHTPQMQATSVDLNIVEDNRTLSERLARLASGEDLTNDDP